MTSWIRISRFYSTMGRRNPTDLCRPEGNDRLTFRAFGERLSAAFVGGSLVLPL